VTHCRLECFIVPPIAGIEMLSALLSRAAAVQACFS
jgi:hypothetical protein